MPTGDEGRIAINAVCVWGTTYQQAAFLSSKERAEIIAGFNYLWVGHCGPAEVIVCDQGGEFAGSDWAAYRSDRGIVLYCIDSGSPWRYARTERAGGLLEDPFAKVWEVLGEPLPDEVNLLDGGGGREQPVCGAPRLQRPVARVRAKNTGCPRACSARTPLTTSSWARHAATRRSGRAPSGRRRNGPCSARRTQMPSDRRGPAGRGPSRQSSTSRSGASCSYIETTRGCRRKAGAGQESFWQCPPSEIRAWAALQGCLLKVAVEQMCSATCEEWLGNKLACEMAQNTLESWQGPKNRGPADITSDEMPLQPEEPNHPDEMGAIIPEVFGSPPRPGGAVGEGAQGRAGGGVAPRAAPLHRPGDTGVGSRPGSSVGAMAEPYTCRQGCEAGSGAPLKRGARSPSSRRPGVVEMDAGETSGARRRRVAEAAVARLRRGRAGAGVQSH